MKIRGVLAAVVGVIQNAIGVLAIVFVYLLNYNSGVQDLIQTTLDMETPIREVLPMFTLLVITFGFFSIVSGLLLIQEWRRSR